MPVDGFKQTNPGVAQEGAGFGIDFKFAAQAEKDRRYACLKRKLISKVAFPRLNSLIFCLYNESGLGFLTFWRSTWVSVLAMSSRAGSPRWPMAPSMPRWKSPWMVGIGLSPS